MMERARYRVITLFITTAVFILSLFIANVFAIEEIFKALGLEKTAQPEVIVRPNVEYKAEGLRDPFQGPIRKETGEEPGKITETPPPSLTVQGIIWGGRFPQAIINNKVVKVGDTIEGVRITDINKDGITIFYEDRQYNLSSPAAGAVPKKP